MNNTLSPKDISVEHMRTARMELPGKVWDELFKLHKNDLAVLGSTLAPYCEIFDADTFVCVVNIEQMLEDAKKQKVKRRISPLLPYLHYAHASHYDYLLIAS